ncbi:MAG: hypothetical protein ACI9WU_002332 [Myxococcota bacterium]|jgi:hypothetical protein
MRTARHGGVQAALMGRVLTIVRGDTALNIPVGEVADLVQTLRDLDLVSGATASAVSASAAVAPAVAASEPAAPKAKPRYTRRGRVWEGVKNFLGQQGRAQSFNSLLRMIEEQQLTDRDATHALKIALGKKVSSGELVRTQGGRYALPKLSGTMKASTAKPAGTRKHRPGELWKQMKRYMADYPDGLTLDALVVAADAGSWTNAESARHAVKICLSRVGDQVERIEGERFRLTAPLPGRTDMLTGTVRRRRKQEGEGDDEATRKFVASSHYPTPRTLLTR